MRRGVWDGSDFPIGVDLGGGWEAARDSENETMGWHAKIRGSNPAAAAFA